MGKYTVSGSVIVKAGADVSTTLNTEYELIFIPAAEAYVDCEARTDFSGSWSSLTDSGKRIVRDITSSKAAIYAINYDTGGYESRMVALDMINVLQRKVDAGIKLLNDDKVRAHIGLTS